MSAGLYIHIPFCTIRCGYCDFFTVTQKEELVPAYISALKNEIRLYASQPPWHDQTFSTVFWGGGTPSLLSPVQIADVTQCAFHHLDFSKDLEVTLESNPNTLSTEKLTAYREAGINRISLGVQSFHESELAFLDRDHSPGQSEQAFEWARAAGFENISIDLIHSLPGQTVKMWRENLTRSVALSPEHISAYCLTYENGTPLSTQLKKGKFRPAPENVQREIQITTMEFLDKNGYRQYEISNFARPDFHARHNRKYWDGSAYLGLGASAHTFDGKTRSWNVRSLHRYIDDLRKDTLPLEGHETLAKEERAFELVYLGLRQRSGVNLRNFERETGIPFLERYRASLKKLLDLQTSDMQLAEDLANGVATANGRWLKLEDGHLRLTREGILLCDTVCAEFD